MVGTGVLATWNESPCGVFKNYSQTEITLAEANETYRFLIGILSSGGRHGMPPGGHMGGAPSVQGQPGQWGAESEDERSSSPTGSHGGVHKQKARGDILIECH